MIGIGILLISIGVLDLVASGIGGGAPRRPVLAWLAAILSAGAAAGLEHWGWRSGLAVAAVAAAVSAAWLLARRPGRPRLALALVALLVGAWLAAKVGEEERWHRTAALVGAFLFLVTPANALVRLALEAAGLEVDREEERMRGGRLIGVVERWLILVLALAGDLTAAGLVIAARSILRFPELAAARRENTAADHGESSEGRIRRVDPTTEYFLLGSMTSWLIAVAVAVFLTRG